MTKTHQGREITVMSTTTDGEFSFVNEVSVQRGYPPNLVLTKVVELRFTDIANVDAMEIGFSIGRQQIDSDADKSAPKRSISTKLVLLALALSPIFVTFALAKIKILRLLVGYLEMPGMWVISIYAGTLWYRLLTGRLRQERRIPADPQNDTFAFVTAIVIAFAIGVFLMELNTHEMVRAFWDAWPASNED